jgi:HSP20 family molecular chaperone IbpA
VPGIRKSDLRIEAKGNTIRIAGTKSVAHEGQAST